MVDDRSKKRASSHWGDVERAAVGRQKTQPGTPVGAPVPEPVDDEIDEGPTPLPMNAAEAHSWQHVGARVSRLELREQAFAQSFPRLEGLITEFVIPAVKDLMGQIDGLLQRQERNSTRLEIFFKEDWPELTVLVGQLAAGLARVEKMQNELSAALSLHHERIARAEKRLDDVERQLGVINLAAHNTRVIAAERRRWLSWGKAGYAAMVAIAGAAGYVVSQLNL